MNDAEQAEQRAALRGRLEFPVVEREGGFSFWRTALDLSPTGMLLERSGSFARRQGSLLELELHLPDAPRPVRVLASFVWAEGTKLGLKFVDISDADRLTLAEALDGLLKDGGALH